jgi:hypothetical protein
LLDDVTEAGTHAAGQVDTPTSTELPGGANPTTPAGANPDVTDMNPPKRDKTSNDS